MMADHGITGQSMLADGGVVMILVQGSDGKALQLHGGRLPLSFQTMGLDSNPKKKQN